MPYFSKIQRFSPDDGPGVRTTFFFKGCSLNCAWCHNPECIDARERLLFDERVCIRCGACHGRRELPAEGCPAGALRMDGFCMMPAEVVTEAERDRRYYRDGGGMTLSGGEPLLYSTFVTEVCEIAAERGIAVAIDTALYVPWENLAAVLPYRPLILADLKAADGAVHRRLTGADNALILENLRRLAQTDLPYWLSIPVVPGANTEELPALAEIVRALPRPPEKLRLLAYHDMGMKKESLYNLPPRGRFRAPTAEEMRAYEAMF